MKKVFVNGTFDLVHVGHIDLLNFARQQGDHLVVGLDADSRVKELKGPGRPIHNERERMLLLLNLRPVDEVVTFLSDDGLEDLVHRVSPDVMVVGSDWKGKKIIGSQFAKELIFYDRIPNFSTTNIIQSIIDRRDLL